MKFRDKCGLALHSIVEGKARTVWTAVIVYVLAVLIMGLTFVALSFGQNMRAAYRQWVKANGVEISQTMSGSIPSASLERALALLDGKDAQRLNVRSYAGVMLFDFGHFHETETTIAEGVLPDASLVGTDAVYLPEEEKANYAVGDSYREGVSTFTVKGFYRSETLTYALGDLSYYHENVSPVSNFSVVYRYADGSDFDGDIKVLKGIRKSLEKIFPQTNNSHISSGSLDMLSQADALSALISAGAALLSLVLLAMSVGSVSNSALISVDRNRRFFGLLRALGAKPRDLKQVVFIELGLTVAAGILPAALMLAFLQGPIGGLITRLLAYALGYVYATTAEAFVLRIVFPFYLPIVCVALFTLAAALFARRGLKGIAARQPTEILSEGDGNER